MFMIWFRLQDANNAPLFCFAKPGIGEPGSHPAGRMLCMRLFAARSAQPILFTKNERKRSFCSSNWLGLQDSNLRMTGPKPVALPLGEGPICLKF